MRYLAVALNGILDLRNFYPLALELLAKHSIVVDVATFEDGQAKLAQLYDGLIVGSDWNQNGDLVRAFRAAGKRTVLLQSEGMFLDPRQWYAGAFPLTDLACLWGAEHETIFRERGYGGATVITGPPRFDIYAGFRPLLGREEVYETLGLDDPGKPYILVLGQFFPEEEFGEALYEHQIALTAFAASLDPGRYVLVKSHPQESAQHYFSRADLIPDARRDEVRVVDRGGHTEAVDVSTLLYHAECVLTYSSTAAIEAMLLNRPAAVFEGRLSSPLANGEIARLPAVRQSDDLLAVIRGGVSAEAYSGFLRRFLPGRITGRYAASAAQAIADYSARFTPPHPGGAAAAKPEAGTPEPASPYRALTMTAYAEMAELLPAQPQGHPIMARAVREARPGSYFQHLHEHDQGYRTNNWLLPELPALRALAAGSVVELGCGNGLALRALAGCAGEVLGLDVAASPMLRDLPRNARFRQADIGVEEIPSSDLVCSADVLQYLAGEELLRTIGRLDRAAPRAYHLIACYDDGHSSRTVASPGLWLSAFRTASAAYRLLDVRLRRNNPDQIVCVVGKP